MNVWCRQQCGIIRACSLIMLDMTCFSYMKEGLFYFCMTKLRCFCEYNSLIVKIKLFYNADYKYQSIDFVLLASHYIVL